MVRIGVDTGGTFTDVVVASEDGLRLFKVPSTPSRPSQAVLEAVSLFGQFMLLHGTTVATNAILERKLARTAFVATDGHAHILHIARQTRPELYDLEPVLPAPPVMLDDCFGIPGRMLHDGTELQPLSIEAVPDLSGFDAAAICLLFGYANPAHEVALRDHIVARWPHMFVSCSHEVSPEFREYERAVATSLNAAVGPLMRSYLTEISGASDDVFVMMSAGGLADVREAIELPVRTMTSGPAAGVVATRELGLRHGRERLIAFDMGGTSTDVSLINGDLSFTGLSDIAGLPARVHRIDVHTIGCGGGSIAHLDQAGALRVGPESAGADPGPALYGRGSLLTVTDANFVLGRLPVDLFGGGSEFALKPEMAEQGLRETSSLLSREPLDVAEAVVEVADAQMAAAVRKVSSARGLDPADFSLVAYGGSGPLHACTIAETLSMREVLVPLSPGVFSALGLLLSPKLREASLTVLGSRPVSDWRAVYDELLEPVQSYSQIIPTADMRYRGQSHELSVYVRGSFADAASDFEALHEQTFGIRYHNREIEWVSARVRAEIHAARTLPEICVDSDVQINETRRMRWRGNWLDAKVVSRGLVPHTLSGPAVILQRDTTTFLPPRWLCERLDDGTLCLRSQK